MLSVKKQHQQRQIVRVGSPLLESGELTSHEPCEPSLRQCALAQGWTIAPRFLGQQAERWHVPSNSCCRTLSLSLSLSLSRSLSLSHSLSPSHSLTLTHSLSPPPSLPASLSSLSLPPSLPAISPPHLLSPGSGGAGPRRVNSQPRPHGRSARLHGWRQRPAWELSRRTLPGPIRVLPAVQRGGRSYPGR